MEFILRHDVRSIHNSQPVYLFLKNTTDVDVDIIWINYTGNYRNIQRIPKKSCASLNTYKTHPLMAINAVTKDRLLMNNKSIFMPETWRERMKKLHPHIDFDSMYPSHEACMLVSITIPLYGLRLRTLLCVRSFLKTEADVDSLNLPAQIGKDLKEFLDERNSFLLLEDP